MEKRVVPRTAGKFHRQITLKHLLINEQKMIGLQFYTDKVIQALVKELPNPRWSDQYQMVYVVNTKQNLDIIFRTFRGVAWVNGRYFFANCPVSSGKRKLNVDYYRKRELPEGYRRCPEEYLQKLELRKYATNTARTYIGLFEGFINQ